MIGRHESKDRNDMLVEWKIARRPGRTRACPAVLGQDLQGGPSSSLSFKNTELDPAPQEALAQAVVFLPASHKPKTVYRPCAQNTRMQRYHDHTLPRTRTRTHTEPSSQGTLPYHRGDAGGWGDAHPPSREATGPSTPHVCFISFLVRGVSRGCTIAVRAKDPRSKQKRCHDRDCCRLPPCPCSN